MNQVGNESNSLAQDYSPRNVDDPGNDLMDMETKNRNLNPENEPTNPEELTLSITTEMNKNHNQKPDGKSTPLELNIVDQYVIEPKRKIRPENPKAHTSTNATETPKQVNNNITQSYARVLTQPTDKSPTSCICSPQSPTKAIKIPMKSANTYREVAETLIPYGPVEAISLDPISQLHTALFECGCQASKAINNLKITTEPFIPPPNFISEYNPSEFLKNNPKSKSYTKETVPISMPPSFPKIFRIKPKENPSIIDILAYLTNEIGKLQPNSITRIRNHFILRVEKDSQSLMISKMDISNSNIVQEIQPHPELNSSKAVCYNKELYKTSKEIIKSYTSPQVQDVHQIKDTNNVTILTFPTSQPPQKIEIFGLTLNLETYREKPKQCKKCFSFMHNLTDCTCESKCNRCSKSKGDHPEEKCNSPPYCYLCKGNHPPTSKNCPIYAFEEDLLNEAIKRGCGRGQIRAERRKATNLQERTELDPETTQTFNDDKIEKKKEAHLSQPEQWTEHQNQRKRRRQRNTNRNRSLTPEPTTFELPTAYSSIAKSRTSEASIQNTSINRQMNQEVETETEKNDGPPDPPATPTLENNKRTKSTLEKDGTYKGTTLNTLQSEPSRKITVSLSKEGLTEQQENQNEEKEMETDECRTNTTNTMPSTDEVTIKNTSEKKNLPENDSFNAPHSEHPNKQQTSNHSAAENQLHKKEATKQSPSRENEHTQTELSSKSPSTTSPQEPPNKRGKRESPNIQNNENLTKTTSTPKKNGSRKMRRCSICKITYKTHACYKEHQNHFHSIGNDKSRTEEIPNFEAIRVPREHKCSEVPHERCLTLYQIYRKETHGKNNSHLVDNREAIYESISHFRRGIKRTGSALKQVNKEKIYGPQSTIPAKHKDIDEPTKPDIHISKYSVSRSELGCNPQNLAQSSKNISVRPKVPLEFSSLPENKEQEIKSHTKENIAKKSVTQQEASRHKTQYHSPMWPKHKSDLTKSTTKNATKETPTKKPPNQPSEPKTLIDQDSQQLQKLSTTSPIQNLTGQPIQTMITPRK